jgi:putative glutamine amidotransferase
MPRPWIGVGATDAEVSWSGWRMPVAFASQSYLDAIAAGGGRPLVLPAVDDASGALARLDGLVLTGGPDLAPEHYGAEPHEQTAPGSARRDRAELALARAAIALDLPLLATCRGLEVLNVALGGTLEQHLPDRVGHDGHLTTSNEFVEHEIEVRTPGPGLPAGVRRVYSYHHQAVERLAADLVPCAWAPDGTIEAARHREATWAVGVQWHPEVGADLTLFEALVAAARARAQAPTKTMSANA